MFATLSDLIAYLTGIYIPLPIQTFGFFMALSFMGAYYTTTSELKRKELQGLIKPWKTSITLNQRVSTQDYVLNMLLGAVLGYKLLAIVLNYDEFVQHTQSFILSAKGELLGAVVGAAIAYYLKKQDDNKAKAAGAEKTKEITMHPHELMTNIVFIAGVTGLLGAKLFHNLENLDDFARDPIDALLSFSGLTFYGGLIVAALAVIFYTRKNGIPTEHMIDAAAPGLMLAYAIGRVGCQLSGDGDWGIVNLAPKPEWMSALPNWMWSFTYPHNVIGEGVPIPGCVGSHCNELPQGVFPTPFYESIMGGLLFEFLWNIRKRINIPGMLFVIYLIANGIERFLIEKIRVNSTYSIAGNAITQAEIISALFVVGGSVALFWLRKKHSEKNTH